METLGTRTRRLMAQISGEEIGPLHTCDTPAEHRSKVARKDYFKKLREPQQKPNYDPDYIARRRYIHFKNTWKAKGLSWTEKAERLAVALIAIGTGSEAAAKRAGVTIGKGLYIYGGVGTGKTTAVRLAMELNILPGRLASCIDMRKEASKGGQEALDKYERGTWCFDDLGQEGECNHYGTKIYPVQDVAFTRYNLFAKSGKFTHFTSNIHPGELTELYDVRFVDRLKQQCNFIEHHSKSWRG